MESEDHIESMYGEICFESVHAFFSTGHILRVPIHFFGPFNKILSFKMIVWIYSRYPCDIIVTKPYYTCYITRVSKR